MSDKTLLRETFTQLLGEITPQQLISRQCYLDDHILTIANQAYDLNKYQKIHLFGSGKAVIPMAEALHEILGNILFRTILVGAYPCECALKNTHYLLGSHPIPSQKSLDATSMLCEALEGLGEDDLFIYLLSGGSSALLEQPESGIKLNELQDATALMLHGGLPIALMNSVREHLSQIKGGKLGLHTRAEGVVLVLSDVVGDDLHAIGSAPLYCDTTTFHDAISALEAYELFDRMPASVQRHLLDGAEGLKLETPKVPHSHIRHTILGSNTIVLEKANMILLDKGIESVVIKEPLQGNADDLANELIAFAKQQHVVNKKCFLFGGESTVVVAGKGKGGRNQHLALCLLCLLDGETDITILSAATDGIDGNSEAAGALIDLHSRHNAQAHHIDPFTYLEAFDSHTFFAKTGEVLITGPTHNNLLDIVMILIEPKITQGVNHG